MRDVTRITNITGAVLILVSAAGCLRTAAASREHHPAWPGAIVVRWSFAGQPVSEETKNVSYSGAAATEFHFQTADGFKPGPYKVQILVDGEPTGERDFRVDQ